MRQLRIIVDLDVVVALIGAAAPRLVDQLLADHLRPHRSSHSPMEQSSSELVIAT
jgi:hypothetical protein